MSIEKGVEYPFIDMASVTPGRKFVSASKRRRYTGSGSKFGHKDTLFARITPCLENGKIAQFVDPPNGVGFGSTEFWVFRARPGVSDPDYVYYLACTELVRQPAEKSMSGASGRQRADLGVLTDLEVPAPPLREQRRIAAVLSAYDDLIENNTRRIAILEEMAQAIYREWFVHFRFPGHEQVEMVESELGPIPAGWEVVPASSAVEINPRIKVDRKEEKPYVPMGGLSERSMLVSPTETRTGASGSKFQNGDTLFARITPCLENGKTGFVQFLPSPSDVAIGSTEFIVLRSRTLSPEFVYLLARSDQLRSPAIKSMTGASGRQRVRLEVFDQIFIAHPTAELISRFRSAVRPMFDLIWALARKNENLRKTRDLLLPKLISGEIEVEALESEPVGAVA